MCSFGNLQKISSVARFGSLIDDIIWSGWEYNGAKSFWWSERNQNVKIHKVSFTKYVSPMNGHFFDFSRTFQHKKLFLSCFRIFLIFTKLVIMEKFYFFTLFRNQCDPISALPQNLISMIPKWVLQCQNRCAYRFWNYLGTNHLVSVSPSLWYDLISALPQAPIYDTYRPQKAY